MRPWIVIAGDFVATGGMDAANHALARGLASRGREVHLVAHRVADDLRALSNLNVHAVARPLGAHALGFPLLDRAGRRLAERLRRREPVVLGNGGNCSAARAVWLHYVHAADRPGPDATRSIPRRAFEALVRRSALRDERRAALAARVVVANSALTARHARELLGAPPERVSVHYYGSDPARFHPAQAAEGGTAVPRVGGPCAVFIGALGDRRKGLDTVLEAWRRLRAAGRWEVRLTVVGSGRELSAWRRRVARWRLDDLVDFTGFVPDVRPHLLEADLMVAPSRYEAYGLAVHEALCCGLPAVVAAEAGVAERMTPELTPLLLRDPTDAEELAGRLRAWWGDREGWAAAAARVGERLRARTWDAMAGGMIELLEARG